MLRFAERGGSVVTLSSVTADTPSAGIGFYGVSKAALNQLTRTLAVELGPRVRVNAVAPAVVRTGFSKALYDGREDEVAAAYPLQRLGEPDDIAAAVAFLASAGRLLDHRPGAHPGRRPHHRRRQRMTAAGTTADVPSRTSCARR